VKTGLLWIAGGVVVAAGVVATLATRSAPKDPGITEIRVPEQAELMCPWREPERDLQAFFPGATGYKTETRILSAQRRLLAGKLGRQPRPDESRVYLHRVERGSRAFGYVVVRRVRGEYGAIELVVAVADGQVRGVRLQRHREPLAVASAINKKQWLRYFEGKRAEFDMRVGQTIPPVPPGAHASAEAVAEGVRSALVLVEVGSRHGIPEEPHH